MSTRAPRSRFAAKIRVRVPSGALMTFWAAEFRLDDGIVTASGWWRHDQSGEYATYLWSPDTWTEVRLYGEVAP